MLSPDFPSFPPAPKPATHASMKHLPNILTGLRLVLTLVVFLAMLALKTVKAAAYGVANWTDEEDEA